MKSNLVMKKYQFIWDKDSMRKAEMMFESNDGFSLTFRRCDFEGVNRLYDIDDWEFLGEVAQEIGRLGQLKQGEQNET